MNPILVALDVDTAAQARDLADALRGSVGGFKIGSQLFTSHGPGFVEELVEQGDRVFLDLKFHDIPNTVSHAVAAAARMGVWMVNVHAAGGGDMMRAAVDAAGGEAERSRRPKPLVIGVTVLTSFNENTLKQIGMGDQVAAQVERLATLAHESGLDGVVASPHEVALVRQCCGEEFLIVTPGIRGGAATAAPDDQHRTETAAGALAAGSSHLVIGRPITAAPNPRAAVERILEECRTALRL